MRDNSSDKGYQLIRDFGGEFRYLSCAILFLVLTSWQFPVCASAQGAVVADPSPQEILEKTQAFYSHLGNYHVVAQMKFQENTDDLQHHVSELTRSSKFLVDLSMREPSSGRIVITEGKHELQLVTDGQTMWGSLPFKN